MSKPKNNPASPPERFKQRLRMNKSAAALQLSIIESEQRAFAGAMAKFATDASLQHAAATLLQARRRYITGSGKSAAFAQLLAYDLAATISNVFLVDNMQLAPITVLSDVRPSDVLVVFSFRRYRSDTVQFGKAFAEAGGQLILVTDSENSPLGELASDLLLVDTISASYVDSPTAVAAVCHLLSSVTAISAKGARRRLSIRDELAEKIGLYVQER